MSSPSSADPQWMHRALALAERGIYTAHPNPCVGCVIVKDGVVVGEGAHLRAGDAHAEVIALRAAGEKAKGADVYVSLEPCSHFGKTPPCSNALIEAGVARVFAAVSDPNPEVDGGGQKALQEAGIAVEVGLCAAQAAQLNRGFFSRMRSGRPYICVKSAIGIDAHISLGDGHSVWVSNEQSREDVQYQRAQSHALLTSSVTVMDDNPELNVRLSASELGIEGAVRQPLRIVLDSRLRTDPAAKIYQHEQGKTVLVTLREDESKLAPYHTPCVEVLVLSPDPADKQHIPLAELFTRLAQDYQINTVQVEAGSALCGALIEQGLCDELLLYVAPKLIGTAGKPFVQFTDIMKPEAHALCFEEQDTTMIGTDTRIRIRVQHEDTHV